MHRNTTALTIALLTGAAPGGPLTPPAGPIASTMKTIAEAEPRTAINAANTPGDADSLYRITQPGSYYLTGNITGSSGKCGIEVAADNVTLDLMGFTLDGTARSGGGASLDGIRIQEGIVINTVIRNGVVDGWGEDGIDLTIPLTTNGGAIIEQIRATNNAGYGIHTAAGSIVRECIASLNGGVGIGADTGSVIDRCTAGRNGHAGLVVGSGSVIAGSVARHNLGNGIFADTHCTVSGCSSSDNAGYGISVQGGCLISACTLGQNSAQGVLANGFRNRIEGNHCTYNQIGIGVTASDNIIIRNTCSSNATNWSIVANNFYGAVVDRTSAATPAVGSNSAAGTMGSLDPNANFTY